MRLSIRAKQIAGVTAIVAVAVVALSGLYIARLGGVMVDESHARAKMLANQILHRISQMKIDPGDPYASLRADPGLQSLVQASIYGEGILYAAILDKTDTVVMHSDEAVVGRTVPSQGDLTELAEAAPTKKMEMILTGDGRTLDVRQLLVAEDEVFGSIRVGVSPILIRGALRESLSGAFVAMAIAIGIAVVVATLLAQVLLRPIHVLRSGLTRLGRGEFGVTLDLPPGDEFGELGSFFNTVSQQLSADRLQLVGQKANLQSAVEHLEDAVALFNPAGELLFSNPAMEPTLPSSAIGQPVQRTLPGDHPYRRIIEE